MGEGIRHNGQKNVTKGKEFHTRTKPWRIILYHTRYMLYLNVKKQVIHRHAIHGSMVLRRFRITMVARGNTISTIIFRMCVRSLSYSACKEHSPHYIVICGLSESTTFFHIVSNGKIFGGKLLKIKCVLIFSKIFFHFISNGTIFGGKLLKIKCVLIFSKIFSTLSQTARFSG
jgi:hypothetical protein